MSEHMNIANTILAQLKAGADSYGNRGIHLMMCWGAREFVAMPATKEHDGALRFRVSGALHKGLVLVKYHRCPDLYTIEIGRVVKGEWRVKKTVERVYCDQLADLIDNCVEKKRYED